METERKVSVLVVDDNDANVMMLSGMLKGMGCDVDEAASGMEAIQKSCQKVYDVIFMDHLMPEMNGTEAIRQILFISSGQEKPIIIGVSANIDQEVVNEFYRAGAADVLERPTTMEHLEEKLKSVGIVLGSPSGGEEMPEKEEIGTILSGVEGLDYQKGLQMLAGSTENYMKVLAACIRNIQENYDSIRLIRDTGQVESLALHFHSLKGIFLNIAADTLAGRSKDFEMAAKEGQESWVHENLDIYMEELENFHLHLKDAYRRYTESNQQKQAGKPLTASEFLTDLDELRQHIDDFEYIEITEKLDEMLLSSQGKQKEGLEKISDAIQDFDYDRAMELTDKLKEDTEKA